MKVIFERVSILSLIFVLAISCDYVSEPFQDNGGGGPIDTNDVVMRNILIEDYTGQKCNNCPRATDAIKVIKGLNGYEGRVVSIAIHTGFFADPKAPPFDADFRTDEGNALESFFKPSGYPTGMVNRVDYPAPFKSYTSWADETSAFIEMEADLSLDISANFDSGSRQVSISVDSEVFNEIVGDFNIVLLLAEDSIVSPQVTPTGNDLDYVHNYVLRKSSNSIWGDSYITGSATEGTKLNYTGTITIENEWREDHCRIIAFVYSTTNQEVIQVNEIKLF